MTRWLRTHKRWMVIFVALLVIPIAYLAAHRDSAPPPISAQSTWTPGYYNLSLEHQGRTRTFWLYIPGGYDPATPAPLVIGLHGGTGTGAQFQDTAEMNAAAETRGFIAVYPDGTGTLQTWNAGHCCGSAVTDKVDDVGFIRALVAALQADLAIDPNRIYATGMSNGAMMCYRLAAEASDLFAAVAPVEGAIGGQFRPRWQPYTNLPQGGPVSLLVIHGMADDAVPYEGGKSGGLFGAGREDLSVAEGVGTWVTHNGCEPTPATETTHNGNIITDSYTCPDGLAVELITVVDGTHSWPGSEPPTRLSDRPNQDIDATALVLDFFLAHPRR